jgi:predicted transposase YbfD/YdcC
MDVSEEDRYYLSNLFQDIEKPAEKALEATRCHWDDENQLHWVHDVTFDGDHGRARTGNAGENFAMLRHKVSCDNAYLLKILAL